jgi:hypothetical protein
MSTLPTEGQDGPEFQFTSLTQTDRQQIVAVAGNQAPGSAFVAANQFRLSALGATLDLLGTWNIRAAEDRLPANNLASWRQLTTEGRDQYVKVVHYGYLFPLGHTATLVQVTNRVLSPDPVSPGLYADAYLQNKSFIRVTEPVKTYPALGQPYGLGAWPFASATILTLTSPDLDAPGTATITPLPGTPSPPSGDYPQAFFPTSMAQDVLWSVHLVDNAGTLVSLQIPLVFVTATDGTTDPPHDQDAPLNQFDAADMVVIANGYNPFGQMSGGPSGLVTSPVAGTPILYAPEVTNNGVPKPGATTHPTLAITLGAASTTQVPTPTPDPAKGSDQYIAPFTSTVSTAELTAANQPAFYPSLLQAQIRLPAAETLSRGSFDDGTGPGGVAIFLYGPYVMDGFTTPASSHAEPAVLPAAGSPIDPSGSTNPGSVYAGLLNQPGLNFPADMVGGLSNPNLGVSGLSGAAGAIGGTLNQYASNAQALISEYFGDLTSSNFLGGLSLADILGDFLGDLQSPSITQQVADDGTRTVTYTLQAQLVSVPTFGFAPVSMDGSFTLTATIVVAPSGSTTYAVQGSVDAFTITILESAQVIQIPFGASDGSTPGATFSASSSAKSNIQVNVGQPSFLGALDFVNTLEQYLSDIGGSGVSIVVAPTQITASISLSLPSVGCGVFNLENLALSASVVVPFLGGATIATFGFCSQEQPFSLTVLCFGGGGYLLVGVGLHSLQSLTASFDFEGQLALDLGVASGGVSAMAGITFSYDATKGSTLTGFVRITGEVEVLGILSISLELQLSLSYTPNIATGTATMTVSVSLCFFSVSVPITVQKSFAGPDLSSSSMATPAVDRVAAGTGPAAVGALGGAASNAGAHGDPAPTSPWANTSGTTFEDQMTEGNWFDYTQAFAS